METRGPSIPSHSTAKADHGQSAPRLEGLRRTDGRDLNLAVRLDAPDCESWDEGRLLVNRAFSRVLRAHGLTTCQALLEYEGGVVVRRVNARETRRLSLDGPEGPVTFYLKRHGPPAWRDRIMPWLHGARPIHGARNEWEAILSFIAAGIPTMTPVAFGEVDRKSLLMTEALAARCNLLELIGGRPVEHVTPANDSRDDEIVDDTPRKRAPSAGTLRALVEQVAATARRMHAAGLHHQDFYLNHLLLGDEDEARVSVIDLGRVRRQSPLALRWIVKDLAQLNFSALRLPARERLRFLRQYLGRPLDAGDRSLIRRIEAKSRRIDLHTRKHDL